MASDTFSLESSRLARIKDTPVFLDNGSIYLKNRTDTRFFFIEKVDEWIKNCKEVGDKNTRRLEICAKVVLVSSVVFSALMPLAFYYLSFWIPLCVGLPVLLGLSFAQGRIKEKIDIAGRQKTYALFLQQFLKSKSFNPLHPFGPWELKKDDRLITDREGWLEDVPPTLQSVKEFEEIAGLRTREKCKTGREKGKTPSVRDLEYSDHLLLYAACRIANMAQREEKWAQVKLLTEQARGHLLRGEIQQFQQKEDLATLRGYVETSKEKPGAKGGFFTFSKKEEVGDLSPNDFPPLSAKGGVEFILNMYKGFCSTFPELEKLYEEGTQLYAACPNVDQRDFAAWTSFKEQALKLKAGLGPVLDLLDKEKLEAADFLTALRHIEEHGLLLILKYSVSQTHEIKKGLVSWIANHPSKKLEVAKKNLKDLNKEVLSQTELVFLRDWIAGHPSYCDQKIVDLSINHGLSRPFMDWIEKNPHLRFESPKEVLARAYKMRKKLNSGFIALKKMEVALKDLNLSLEYYQGYIKALDLFYSEVLSPLKHLIDYTGETSKVKFFLKAFFHKDPVLPFVKKALPETESPLRSWQFEELSLDRLLEAADSKMVWTARGRTYLLRIPLIILFAVEGIFSFYFTTPWIFWGCCALSLVGEAISLYIDSRIKEMERKKQGIKMQYLLRNYPDIRNVPGTCKKLSKVKKLQGYYGLEGVRPTWARALTEGDSVLPRPKSREEAKEIIRKLGEEGSKQAAQYLNRRLGVLRSEYRDLPLNSPKRTDLADDISEMEKALWPSTKNEIDYTPRAISAYEKYTIARTNVDSNLDKIVDRMSHLKIKKTYLEKAARSFRYLEKQIPLLRDKNPLLEVKIALLKNAYVGEGPRHSTETPESILDELKNLQDHSQESFEEKSNLLLERLRAIPKDALYNCLSYLIEEQKKLPRAERKLNLLLVDEDYVSKENVANKLQEIDVELKELEKLRLAHKEKYDQLTELIAGALKPESPETAPENGTEKIN